MKCGILEKEELNHRADNVTTYEEAIPLVKEYEIISRLQKKNMQLTNKAMLSRN